MAQQIADRRDIDFVLHEQLGVDKFSEYQRYSEFNKKTIELIVNEARNLAVKELLATQKAGDDKGVEYQKDGSVNVPEEFHRAYQLIREGEWTAPTEDPEWGGQGMPMAVSMAASDYLLGANYSLMMYIGLTQGAGHLIEAFGTEDQKNRFLKKLYTGEWAGTMALTETEAGSDVGSLTTTATRNEDGTYSISGNKIWISGGEQDLTENIVHPVLARIEGAPAGTKGISLFLVPKYRVNEDGSLGDFNDVVCTGVEHKMGIHGSATTFLAFGSKGQCRGLLLGEENKGMREMFLMMNEARLLVGMQGLACASASYLNAVNYARQRIQGKHLKSFGDKDASSVTIIEHPDVRRMLMAMKAHVEGMRSLIYYVGYLEDLKNLVDSNEKKDKYQGIIDVLIPVCKGYVTDRSNDVCDIGLQVYGGYGYSSEYPQEQLLRDCRITRIYEGTNGIQAMDLLGRKLGWKNGQAIMDLMGEMQATLGRAKELDALSNMASEFEKAFNRLGEVSMTLGGKAMSEEVLNAFANAYPFMEVCGDVVMTWMLLWRATEACEKMEKAKKKDREFYEGQIKNLEYFVVYVLPTTIGKMESINQVSNTVVDIGEGVFGGK